MTEHRAAPDGSGLVDRLVDFTAALRRSGVGVSTAETVDAARVLTAVDLLHREQLREGLAASLVKRPVWRPSFDVLFDLYFPPVIGDGVLAELAREDAPPPPADPDGETAGEGLAPQQVDREALRDELRQLLLDGDDDELARFTRRVVTALGRTTPQPGRQSWFAYRVLRQLSPQTLLASMVEALLAGQDRGGMAERVARQLATERIRRFEEQVEAEIRRRLAEEKGVEQLERSAVKPMADQVDFLRANREDLAELRRQVYPLARRLATTLAARRRLGKSGRLDFRRTVRASLATGGVPLVTHHKPYRPHKPELVVLCDVSGSVASFAHFTLLLTHALREQFTRVRAFAFIDTCDEVTRYFAAGDDLGSGMARMAAEADLVWFDGHSDYGHSFTTFEEKYADAVTPRSSLLVLGDARNNFRAPAADALHRLATQARHTYWLNPEPRSYWGSGDSATRSYEPVVDEMVECRNAAQLADFVERILPGA
jgi:uncharacterized protein with von Willebrand factor type A (vWA) domain